MIVSPRGELDAYGEVVKDLLRRTQSRTIPATTYFAQQLIDSFRYIPAQAAMLERFSPVELNDLTQRIGRYLATLVSPELTRTHHHSAAEAAGRVHAIAGVEILWLLKAYGAFERDALRAALPAIEDALEEHLMRGVLFRRLHLDLESQVTGYGQIEDSVTRAHAELDEQIFAATNIADLQRRTLAIIAQLPGGLDAFFARADSDGSLQIEGSSGDSIDHYLRSIETGVAPRISIDPSVPAGQGPSGSAWQSRKIQLVDSWGLDHRTGPWRPLGLELGFRSSASVPLIDAAGNTVAILTLYSKVLGYFSTPRMRGFISHLQHLVEHALQQLSKPEVVPYRVQDEYRRLLAGRNVVLLYQPIMDLRSGKIHKLEALARLRREDGSLVPPLHFLSSLGEIELLDLFRQAVAQICVDFKWLEQRGLSPLMAVNLPAEALGREDYEQALMRLTSLGGLPPHRLSIEVLESGESTLHSSLRAAFISRLRERGFQLAQDDLGAGYSSLLRMDELPFDEVKIDQALVRGAADAPHRALEFIFNLTRLAHACDTRVTVEGLESDGLIEAATILGADFGQGYGISPPIPVADIPAWLAAFRLPTLASGPSTTLGKMARDLRHPSPDDPDRCPDPSSLSLR